MKRTPTGRLRAAFSLCRSFAAAARQDGIVAALYYAWSDFRLWRAGGPSQAEWDW